MSNQTYINMYKDTDEIIQTYYQIKDRYGRLINVDGLVNPVKIDNRQMASVTDQQGDKPHCAAYSIANLAEAIIWKRTGRLINLNADQIYAKAKLMDGDQRGEGTYLEYAIKAALNLGGIANADKISIGYIYNDGSDALIDRIKYLIHKYDILHVGFNITTGWYSCGEQNPTIRHTGVSCGGHAVLICGYDQDGVYIQNSWGKEWAAKGFALMPWTVFRQEFIYGCFLQNCYDGLAED